MLSAFRACLLQSSLSSIHTSSLQATASCRDRGGTETRRQGLAWPIRGVALAASLLCLAPLPAVAGGPGMPWQLLADRAATLASPPRLSFAEEVLRLVRPPGYAIPRVALEDGPTSAEEERAAEDRRTVGLPGLAIVELMREAETEAEAVALGQRLPPAIRLYTLGARAFLRGEFDAALAHFRAVLDLPPEEADPRAVWAQFMIGRTYRAQEAFEAAANAFHAVRLLAEQGADDGLAMAAASLGEEARVRLARAFDLLDGTGPERTPSIVADALAEADRAVGLYAEQAARGDARAIESLLMVGRQLIRSEHVSLFVRAPVTQRVLLAYLLSRPQFLPWEDVERLPPTSTDADTPDTEEPQPTIGGIPVIVEDQEPSPDEWRPELRRLIEVFLAVPPTELAGADRLAAVAYRAGRYDIAQRFAVGETALALWVRAKLALRNEDTDAALDPLARAVAAAQAEPRDEGATRSAFDRTRGELALVHLVRGEHDAALAMLVPLGRRYWGDLVHVAERVMTLDELKQFVDGRLPALVDRIPLEADRQPDRDAPVSQANEVVTELRWLLARRLMRAGRIDEALPYFPERDPATGTRASYRDLAIALRRARWDGDRLWWQADRARARFEAANITLRHGMALMGTEGPPDFRANGGNFAFGFADTSLEQNFVTASEARRAEQHAPDPNSRFHYRLVAASLAMEAADLLPARSQAFAAVLCHATNWKLRAGAVADARATYARYLREGALMSWGTRFGEACPTPDFEAAGRFWLVRTEREAERWWRRFERHAWWVLPAAVGGVLLAVLGFLRARRVWRGHIAP